MRPRRYMRLEGATLSLTPARRHANKEIAGISFTLLPLFILVAISARLAGIEE